MKRATKDGVQAQLRMELAKAVADRDVPDDVIDATVKQLGTIYDQAPFHAIKVFPYGIIIDRYLTMDRWKEALPTLFDRMDWRTRRIETFPIGIIDPDLMRLAVEHQVPELIPFTRDMGLAGGAGHLAEPTLRGGL